MTYNKDFGFVRVAAAVPRIKVGDVEHNLEQHIALIRRAQEQHVQVLVFPELSLTGYTCQDLFFSRQLICDARSALDMLCEHCYGMMVVVGLPLEHNARLYNMAAVVVNSRVVHYVPKTYLPNNGEFYEKRWFAGADDMAQVDNMGSNVLFDIGDCRIGIELCEDLWTPLPPSTVLAMHGADVILNLSASNEVVGKDAYRRQLVCQQSARTHSAYIYASSGVGESTQDTVFGGATYIAENGRMLAEGQRFARENQLLVHDIDIERLRSERMRNSNFAAALKKLRCCDIQVKPVNTDAEVLPSDVTGLMYDYPTTPFVPPIERREQVCQEIFAIQTAGLAKRWEHIGLDTLVIGISGGLDSTLALLAAVKTADMLHYDRKRIVGVTMPGFGTTGRTLSNAVGLMTALGITQRNISIVKSVTQHLQDIEHDINNHDVTYENGQARERTQILMDIANQTNGLVVGTGDLSELALGWATYNGDHMSMYGINSGIPKTLVRYLVAQAASDMQHSGDKAAADILLDVLDTPVSPELLPADKDGNIAQITEDLVGPYQLHDFFLYHFLRFGFSKDKLQFIARRTFHDIYDHATIDHWLTTFCRRFFNQQFKRSCLPDGPKVGSVNLSPRGDWRMPSDAVCFLKGTSKNSTF